MSKIGLIVTAAFGLLSACAVPQATPVTLSTAFNAAEVAWANGQGNNTITGSAVLRTVGGDPKTCAGFAVTLTPVSTYSSEIMAQQFGSTTSGFIHEYSIKNVSPESAYFETQRSTTCDAQGRFVFSNVPDGDWFVTTKVTWGAVQGGRYSYVATQGGYLMQQVNVSGGQTKDIVLTA
jgi:hypothetical protein